MNKETKNELLAQSLKLLLAIQWNSYEQGQGSGFMSSGGDGPWVAACPECTGIDPKDRNAGDFTKSDWGHKRSCKLNKLIKRLVEAQS